MGRHAIFPKNFLFWGSIDGSLPKKPKKKREGGLVRHPKKKYETE